jgi:tRNA G37 N-methylase Trm5
MLDPCLNLLELARLTVQRAVRPGDMVVDATAGNGHDTLFLARLVGRQGLVLAFETQPTALENTKALLRKARAGKQVRLLAAGHESLALYLAQPNTPPARLSAAMFNLGFLPGSNKEITTQPATTLAALEALLPYFNFRGVISVHCYSGHQGGREESRQVLAWAARQPRRQWWIYRYHTFNKIKAREDLLLLERRQD